MSVLNSKSDVGPPPPTPLAAAVNPSVASTAAVSSVTDARGFLGLVKGVLDPLIPQGCAVALFDFPNHSNVGDSAIWLGVEAYLSTRTDLRTIVVDDHRIRHRSLPPLPGSAVILINGGGNLGDYWPHHQALREKIIERYGEHRIIQLPQSIHFEDAVNEERCRRAFSGHREFHLLVRDHHSLQQGQRLHEGQTSLCPDMALCLGHLPRVSDPRHTIVQLLRTDKEAATCQAPQRHMEDTIVVDWLEEPTSLTWRVTERVERFQARYPRRLAALYGVKCHLYHRLAMERLKRGCDILGSGQVVITDRLHAHILCTLMGIPHVVLDNNYRKIGNFRDTWHTSSNHSRSAASIEEAIRHAQGILSELISPKRGSRNNRQNE